MTAERTKRVAVLVAAALACAGVPAALASEPDIAGMGARSAGMAGTGVADAEGYDATYANPAGLMEPTHRRLTVGYLYGNYQLHLDGAPRPVDDTSGLVLGAAVPLPFGGVLRDRLAIGLALYFPTSVLNRARSPFPDEPRLALLETRTQVVTVVAALAARVHERFTIGVGVLVLAALIGEIRITPDAAGHLTTVAEEQIVVNYSPVIGARVKIHETLRLGAVFRGESKATYDIQIDSDLGSLIPLTVPTLHIAGVAQYDPLQAALEAAWRPRPWLHFSGGLTWKHWSAFPEVTRNATLGTPPQAPNGFHDTVVPRLALEIVGQVGPVRLAGRGGYLFEWSPAPSAGATTTLIDADRHVITLGFGLDWHHRYGVLVVDLFGQWHQLGSASRTSGSFFLLGGTVGVDL